MVGQKNVSGIEAIFCIVRKWLGYWVFILLITLTFACKTAARGTDVLSTLAATKGVQLGELDDETLGRLELSIGKSGQAQPGDRFVIKVGTNECCYYFQPVLVDVLWSIDPASGAKIDPRTGEVVIDHEVKSGSLFTVTANVGNGRRILTGDVLVYRLDDNPLVGVWHESSQIACENQSSLTEDDILRELVFKADGTFQATFTPFEIYHDYWGSYKFDLKQSTLVLKVTDGNYVPTEMDLEGTFILNADGSLELRDMWLGRRDQGSGRACGQIFVK
jgi:hypothetical protein